MAYVTQIKAITIVIGVFDMPTTLIRKEDLNPQEQLPIVNLPLNDSYIVRGGPGTGKTIMAIIRAEQLRANNQRLNFLVFNKPLCIYIQELLR